MGDRDCATSIITTASTSTTSYWTIATIALIYTTSRRTITTIASISTTLRTTAASISAYNLDELTAKYNRRGQTASSRISGRNLSWSASRISGWNLSSSTSRINWRNCNCSASGISDWNSDCSARINSGRTYYRGITTSSACSSITTTSTWSITSASSGRGTEGRSYYGVE